MRPHPLPTSADDLTWAEVHDFEALEWALRNLGHQLEDVLSIASKLTRHLEVRTATALMQTWRAAILDKPEGTAWSDLDELLTRAGSEHARMGGVVDGEEIPF